MTATRSLCTASLSTLAIAIACTTSAVAQDVSQSADIVVTAQRRSQSQREVPASLTVITSDTLRAAGVQNNLDLANLTPGLKMDKVAAFTAPAIRGITTVLTAPGLDPNVATYIDGVYQGDPLALTFDLPDVQQVEVLKGPQGTLFGRNATGGAIQVTTKAPSFTPTGRIDASYGSFHNILVQGYLSGPLNDRIAVSLTALKEKSDGYYWDLINNKHVGGINATLLRGKLLWRAGDTDVTLSAYYSRRKDPSSTYGTPLDGNSAARNIPGSIIPTRPYDVAVNRPIEQNVRSYGGSLKVVSQLDSGTVTALAAYNNYLSTSVNDAYFAFAPTGGLFYINRAPARNYSAEINYASKWDGPLNLVTGLFYYDDRAGYDPLNVVSDPLGTGPSTYAVSIFGQQTSKSWAGYAEFDYKIADALTLIAGLRYSHEKRTVYGQSVFGLTTTQPGPSENFGKVSFNGWTPRVSLRYRASDDVNLYATWSRGFKSGGFNPSSIPFSSTAADIDYVRPEKVDAFEIGAKAKAGHWLSVNAAGYYYRYTDQQVNAYTKVNGVDLGVIQNAASANIYGGELEGTANLTTAFALRFGLSVLHARYDSKRPLQVNVPNGTNSGNVTVSRVVSGNALPRSPDFTLSVGANYEADVGGGTLRAGMNGYYSTRIYYEPGNVYSQKPYATVDGQISFEPGNSGVRLSVWGRNLTDQTIISGSFVLNPGSGISYAAPRSVGVGLSYAF